MDRPTLVVGLGGKGIDIVCNLADRVQREHRENVQLLVMDTDANWLKGAARYPNVRFIQTSPRGTVGEALNNNDAARNWWFPVNEGLNGKVFTEGAGQVRAISRLALDFTIAEGKMKPLEDAIAELRGLDGSQLQQELRIVITGSIAGGTGSGLILPVALYIRNYLITRYQDYSALIRGYFLEPDTLFSVISDESERNSLRANAYATIRELDAFFKKESSKESPELKHVVFNAPQPGLGKRVDYPNILPYNFVFLMDAVNEDGEHLKTESYTDHVSDVIYAQALGPISDSSNSSEDNVIRNLAASRGTARYGGAGCSYLEYPAADVQRYIGLNWAKDSISGEWLELDREFDLLRRTEGKSEDDRGATYISSFEARLDEKRPFYVKAYEGVTRTETIKVGPEGNQHEETREVKRYEGFVRSLVSHAGNWSDPANAKGVVRESEPFRTFWTTNGKVLSSDVIRSAELFNKALDQVDYNKEDFIVNCTMQFERARDAEAAYLRMISEEVRPVARLAARNAFTVSEYETDPIGNRSEPWQLEGYLRSQVSGKFIHPSGVRYVLYQSSHFLEQGIEELVRQRDQLSADLSQALDPSYDYNSSKEGVQSIRDTVAEAQVDRSLRAQVRRIVAQHSDSSVANILSPETVAQLENIGKRLNDNRTALGKLRELTCQVEFLQAAKAYVDELSRAYEAFYRALSGAIMRIDDDIQKIENDSRFNTSLGMTRRYVCASKECLRYLLEECLCKGSAADLPGELCQDVYLRILRHVQGARTEAALGRGSRDEDRRRAKRNMFFRSLVQTAVLDFWRDRVMSEQDGYPTIVDKSIFQAIRDEAYYLAPANGYVGEVPAEYVASRFAKTIAEAGDIAVPFIEHSSSAVERRIKKCLYSEDALEDCGEHRAAVREQLESLGSIHEDPDDPADRHVIMFYRAVYGLRAQDLPKFAPAYGITQKHQDGEYHRAYWDLVDQIGPNLAENKLITPHIDKNWHLVAYLPDISETNERAIKDDIVRVFIYGLTNRKFSVVDGNDGREYRLGAGRYTNGVTLLTSNGTICDRFYELYDALKINPPVVRKLLESYDRDLTEETNGAFAPTASSSALVRRYLHSQAFLRPLDDRAIEARVGGIAAALDVDRKLLDADDEELGRRERRSGDFLKALLDSCAEHMFGTSPRRSILEIPFMYAISLPNSEERFGETEDMVDGIFSVVHDYLERVSRGSSINDDFGRLMVEQYLVFEENLVTYETSSPNIHTMPVVSTIREKASSYFPVWSKHGKHMDDIRSGVTDAWRAYDHDGGSGFGGGILGGGGTI